MRDTINQDLFDDLEKAGKHRFTVNLWVKETKFRGKPESLNEHTVYLAMPDSYLIAVDLKSVDVWAVEGYFE